MCVSRPVWPRRLRALLSAYWIGRSQSLRALKRGHWRLGTRRGRRGRGLAIVTCDAERGQLLQERPAACLGRGNAVLRLAHRAQLVLRQLGEVLDLRHARRPNHRLLGRRRNEFLLRQLFRFLAGLDRVGEGRDGRDILLADERSGGRVRLTKRGASRTKRGESARPRQGFRPRVDVDLLDLSDRLLIDAGGHHGNAHHAIERRIRK